MKIKPIFYIIFLMGLLYITLLNIDPMLLWDENVYLGNARALHSESNFTEDFRFPLLEYLIALVWLFTGESLIVAKLLMVAMSLATIYLFYKICEYYIGKEAVIPTIVFALSPLMIFWGFRIYTEIPALFFMTLSFYMLIRNQELLSGIFAGLAFLSKFPFALFALAVGLSFMIEKKIKKAFVFSLGFLLAIIPWMTYNYVKYGNIFWDALEQLNVISKWTSPQPIIVQLVNFFELLNLLTILFLIGFIYIIAKDKKVKILKSRLKAGNAILGKFSRAIRSRMLWSSKIVAKCRMIKPSHMKIKYKLIIILHTIIFFVYYLFFVNLKLSRYYLANLTFIYLFIAVGYIICKNFKSKYSVFITGAVLLIAVILAIDAVVEIREDGYCNSQGKIQAIDFVVQNTDSKHLIISNFWPWFGYYNNNRISSMYDEDILRLKNQTDATYIIYSPTYGDYYNKTELDRNLRLIQTFNSSCNDIVYVYE